MTENPQADGLADLFAELLDALPVGLVVLTPVGRVIEANPRATAILGDIPRGELFAQRLLQVSVDSQGRPTAELATSGAAQRVQLEEARSENGLRLLVIEDVTAQALDDAKAAEERRMATLGAVAARLAHQMRTPLTSALLNASLVHKRTTDALSASCLNSLIDQLHTLESRVAALLRYTKGVRNPSESFSLAVCAQAAQGQVRTLLRESGAQINIVAHSDSAISGPKEDVTFAMVSALENSLEAGAREIQIAVTDADGYSIATITDDGNGSKLDASIRYDEPFFTTKPHGTGLGLAIAAEAARACGGDLQAHPTPEGFRVVFRARTA